jgi:hypothetical protein
MNKMLGHHNKMRKGKDSTSPSMVETIIEPYDDGWPDNEEPFVDVQRL